MENTPSLIDIKNIVNNFYIESELLKTTIESLKNCFQKASNDNVHFYFENNEIVADSSIRGKKYMKLTPDWIYINNEEFIKLSDYEKLKSDVYYTEVELDLHKIKTMVDLCFKQMNKKKFCFNAIENIIPKLSKKDRLDEIVNDLVFSFHYGFFCKNNEISYIDATIIYDLLQSKTKKNLLNIYIENIYMEHIIEKNKKIIEFENLELERRIRIEDELMNDNINKYRCFRRGLPENIGLKEYSEHFADFIRKNT